MKKINKQQLMLLAWQFYYQTRDDFATCLSKAWANAKLLRALHSCVCHFFYSKVDGTRREAWGTLRDDLIPATSCNDNRRRNNTVQVYFDTERNEYRCYKKLNLCPSLAL